MALDSDLVGVIVACSVVGAILVIIVILSSIFCFRRIESKRRKDKERRLNGNVGWPAYPPTLQPIGPHFGHSNLIGGYRPRILSPSSPGNSQFYNTPSTNGGLDDAREIPDHQTPNHHPPSSSSSPHHSVSTKANGHALIPIPAGYSYFGYGPERPDFYDARRKHIPQHEEVIETIHYPDQPYHSTLKDHIKGPAPDVPQSPATKDNHNGIPQQPLQQKDSPSKGSTKKSPKKKSKKDKAGDKVMLVTTTESESSNANATEAQQQPTDAIKDIDLNLDEAHANSTNYKVIKKPHNHTKMPDWMVRDYGEQGESIEMEGEGDAAAMEDQENGVPGMVSVMVRDYSIRGKKPEQQQESSDQHAMSWSTTEESTTSIVQDYSSTNYIKNFSILDYVDPPGGPSPDENQNTGKPSRETVHVDAAILDHKAAVLKQIREKVNESAEQMPPAFTSTPRVDPEVVSDQSSDELLSRRQRPGSDGSVATLPPAIDTNL